MFREFKKEVEKVLTKALKKASYAAAGEELELEESEHADISSRVAFSLARTHKQPPSVVAEEIVRHLELTETSADSKLILKAVAVGPYINFYANDFFLQKTLQRIKDEEGAKPAAAEKRRGKIIIEHTSANADGPLHIGHLRNAIIGDVLVRVLKRAGFAVETQYYVNDMGRQIGVAVWGAERLEVAADKKPDHAVADVYIAANKLLEAEKEAAAETVEAETVEAETEAEKSVGELMRKYEVGDEEVVRRYKAVVEKCLSGVRASLERLNIRHDLFVWESEFVRSGAVAEVLEELKRKGEVRFEGSAVLLKLEGIGKELVVQRSDGTSLYTARDLAYHRWKSERGDRVDRIIDVFGKDHELVSQQLAKALEILGVRVLPEFVLFEFVSLPSGSLSTRAGRYISVDELIEKIEERAYEEVSKRRRDLSEGKRREIARRVGVGALRYDIVKVSPEKHIVFDLENALDIEKKGAPFVQYSHARACSILRAATAAATARGSEASRLWLHEESEKELVKKLAKFESVVEAAASELRPHLVAKYARELAESFNLFYKDCPVLTAEKVEVREARLVLVECAKIVLSRVLEVLGVEAPEEM
ncbi:MAG: arginine--tRNA ligase [Candidatus Methanophagaceae archaeon]|nr:MAG: arginine--tRNA ligase [Methanophagales archaeon]